MYVSIRMGCGRWLRFFIVIGDVGLNWLLIGDVRGELVVNDCHWVVMWGLWY